MLLTFIGVKPSERARIEGRKGFPKGKETVVFVPLCAAARTGTVPGRSAPQANTDSNTSS
jgi:hypothetical protein